VNWHVVDDIDLEHQAGHVGRYIRHVDANAGITRPWIDLIINPQPFGGHNPDHDENKRQEWAGKPTT
jgi:hypothetical protein